MVLPKALDVLTVAFDQEDAPDHRHIADIAEYPGVMAYGATRAEAYANALRLLANVIADGLVVSDPPPASPAAATVDALRTVHEATNKELGLRACRLALESPASLVVLPLALEVLRLRAASPPAPSSEASVVPMHDPIADEAKLYTLDEFIKVARNELAYYHEEWTKETNEYHQASHTYQEWYGSYHRWSSW